MMRGIGSMFGAGQREVSTQSLETEVKITLSHTAWASGIAAILAIVARFAVIIPLVQAINKPGLYRIEPRASGLLVVFAAALPWAVMVVSFLLQILNINFPPKFIAARPELGFFGGMFRRGGDTPIEAEVYEGDTPQVNAPQPIPVEFLTGEKGHITRSVIEASSTEWTCLKFHAAANKPFSIRELIKAGIPDTRARELCKQFSDGGLTEKDAKSKEVHPITRFRTWLLSDQWRKGTPLPQK